ncbi:MAG: flavin reductase family protein [Rhizobiales bacterium]|nr:flavin reductase family protein [Hyphomicrobiales bacterium]OJU30079.1 MAG: flavin reductase [Rhizobiales bacterium 68-8]
MIVFDSRTFREALGHYASGITVIGAMVDGAPVGFTCQSFFSVSMDPPLVSFSVMKTSSRWPKVRSAGKFSINVLSATQRELADQFGRHSPENWAGIPWRVDRHDNPGIDDVLLRLDCSLTAEHEAGDHWVVIAAVEGLEHADAATPKHPLLYYRGKYHRLEVD